MGNALVPVQTAVGLPELAAEINNSHACVEQTFREGVTHAIHAGELLLAAKASMPHGQWEKWLKANITFRPRTARVYMQLAGLDAEKRQRVADLPLRKAINAVSNLEYLNKAERREELRREYLEKNGKEEFSGVVYTPPVEEVVRESSPAENADLLIAQLVEAAAFERVAIEHLRDAFARRFGGGSSDNERVHELARLQSENTELRRQLAIFKSPVRCEFVEDDGGRRAAGYGEPEGDCVARAIAIATCKPYAEVFEELKKRHARYVGRLRPGSENHDYETRRRKDPINNGCAEEVSGPYLKSLGWQYTRLREQTYLRAGALPSGRLIVSVHGHYVALIDGAIRDTYDSGGAGKRPVKGYWSKTAPSEANDNNNQAEQAA